MIIANRIMDEINDVAKKYIPAIYSEKTSQQCSDGCHHSVLILLSSDRLLAFACLPHTAYGHSSSTPAYPKSKNIVVVNREDSTRSFLYQLVSPLNRIPVMNTYCVLVVNMRTTSFCNGFGG